MEVHVSMTKFTCFCLPMIIIIFSFMSLFFLFIGLENVARRNYKMP